VVVAVAGQAIAAAPLGVGQTKIAVRADPRTADRYRAGAVEGAGQPVETLRLFMVVVVPMVVIVMRGNDVVGHAIIVCVPVRSFEPKREIARAHGDAAGAAKFAVAPAATKIERALDAVLRNV